VWVATFQSTPDAKFTKIERETPISVTDFIAKIQSLSGLSIVCGEGASRVRDAGNWGSEKIRFVVDRTTAEAVATYAVARVSEGESLTDISPIYASPSQAERNFGVIVTAPDAT
jgi:hypothetical protein